VDIAKLDFRPKSGSRVLKDLPGFKEIPVDKIGLFTDGYRKVLPSDHDTGRRKRIFFR
jgi:hypothetical protein